MTITKENAKDYVLLIPYIARGLVEPPDGCFTGEKEIMNYLPLVRALSEGKAIEVLDDVRWFGEGVEFCFNFPAKEYRVKRTPREFWIVRVRGRDDLACSNAYEAAYRAENRAEDTGAEVIHVKEVLA